MDSFQLSTQNVSTLIFITLTLLISVLIDTFLRSLIKVPKQFENRRARTYVTIAQKSVTVVVYLIAALLISNKLGINLTPLLASASIIGIVVGIGARSVVEDLISGFFILTQDSIAIGDYIKVDSHEGIVEKLGFRSLTLRGDSGELHIIPNGLIKTFTNYSRGSSYMYIDFTIKATQDTDKVIKAMEEALLELKKDKFFSAYIYDKSEVMGISEYKSDAWVVMRTKIVMHPSMREKVAYRYRYLGKKSFTARKISFT